jgi:hypothetical protein
VPYLISGGSIPIFVAILVALSVAQRVAAVHLTRRHGEHPPSWWKM